MKSLLLTLLLLASTLGAAAQTSLRRLKKAPAIEVTYQTFEKGRSTAPTLQLLADSTRALLLGQGEVQTILDFDSLLVRLRVELKGGEVISSRCPFHLNEGLAQPVGSGKLLGLPCSIYRMVLNSNTYEMWVTRSLPFRGTPQYQTGVPDGLVLKIVRNGDREMRATVLVPIVRPLDRQTFSVGRSLREPVFYHTLRQSRVETVRVFDQERVCFDGSRLPHPDSLMSERVYRCGGGSIILKKVRLPETAVDRQVFVELTQYSDGDAYDRTGSVFVVPTGKAQSFLDAIHDLKSVPSRRLGGKDFHALVSTPAYDAPLELMRFITGFGVRRCNSIEVPGQTWADSVFYKTEVTDIAAALKGEVWVGAYVGNWDKDGHKLSLALKYYPGGPTAERLTLPLFNTVNYLEQAGQPYPDFLRTDSLTVPFHLDHDTPAATLVYLTTGHGGWGGGDEFNPKPNTIVLDGRPVISFIPWRDDCGTYRHQNPCSGNFDNGLSSSDLSRSNWCPATVTTPERIPLGALTAGDHVLTIKIPQGAPEGSSISYWCLSGTLVCE